MPDVEWHEPGAHEGGTSETLAGQDDRPPLRHRLSAQARTALLAVGALMVVPVIGVAAVRVVHGTDDPTPSSRSTTAPPSGTRGADAIPPSERTFAIENTLNTVQSAIRQAFATGTVTMTPSYADGGRTVYSATVGQRRVLIVVGRDVRQPEFIGRTAHSVRIAQRLQNRRVDVTVTVATGPTTARDFQAAQTLVRDVRLLRDS